MHLSGFSSGLLQKICASWSTGGDQDRQLLLVPFQMTQVKPRQISFFSIFERELILSLKAREAVFKCPQLNAWQCLAVAVWGLHPLFPVILLKRSSTKSKQPLGMQGLVIGLA